MLKYKLYLNDILRTIKLIEFSTKNINFDKFDSDRNLIDATCMRIQVIGESIKKIPKEVKERYPKIDWKRFLDSRNIISHSYFAVNPMIIWTIIRDEIPVLKKQIREVLNREIKNE